MNDESICPNVASEAIFKNDQMLHTKHTLQIKLYNICENTKPRAVNDFILYVRSLKVEMDISYSALRYSVFPLVKVDYLVNSQYPQNPSMYFHFESRGSVDIIVEISEEIDGKKEVEAASRISEIHSKTKSNEVNDFLLNNLTSAEDDNLGINNYSMKNSFDYDLLLKHISLKKDANKSTREKSISRKSKNSKQKESITRDEYEQLLREKELKRKKREEEKKMHLFIDFDSIYLFISTSFIQMNAFLTFLPSPYSLVHYAYSIKDKIAKKNFLSYLCLSNKLLFYLCEKAKSSLYMNNTNSLIDQTKNHALQDIYSKIFFFLSSPFLSFADSLSFSDYFKNSKGAFENEKNYFTYFYSNATNIIDVNQKDDNRRKIPEINPKEKDNDGIIPSNSTFNFTNLYIFVVSESQWNNYLRLCLRNSAKLFSYNFAREIFIPTFKRYPVTSYKSVHKALIDRSGRYSVLLFNGDRNKIKVKSTITLLNLSHPKQKHLSFEQFYISHTIFFLMILYFITTIVTGFIVLFRWKNCRTWMHVFFLINFFLSFLLFFFDFMNCLFVLKNGMKNQFVWYVAQILRKISDIVNILIFVLIALGYLVLRTYLNRIEMQLCIALFLISLYLGLFEVFFGEFQASRYILHAVAFLCILVATNFNGALLHSYLNDAGFTSRTAELYHKYRAYSIFRLLFLSFLTKPIFMVFYKVTFLSPINDQISANGEFIFLFIDNLFDYLYSIAIFVAFQPPKIMGIFKNVLETAEESMRNARQLSQRENSINLQHQPNSVFDNTITSLL